MSGYADDYDDRNDRDDRRNRRDRDDDRDDGVFERARAKVGTPAMLLIVTSLIGALIEFGFLILMVTAPTIFYDALVDFIKNQPNNPQQQQQLKDMEAQKDGMRLDSPMNIGSTVLGLIINLVGVVGGIKMRSLSGYPIALTGAIAGIIPMGGCCCLTLPMGIWALVVLMNEDVKTAFARGRAPQGEY